MVSKYLDQTMVTITEQVTRRTITESRIEAFKDLMATMRSTGDAGTSRQLRATIPKAQGYLVPDFGSKGRPSGDGFSSNVSARGEAGVVGGVSRVLPSGDSSPPPTTTSSQGSRVGWRKGRRARKVVFNQPVTVSPTRPATRKLPSHKQTECSREVPGTSKRSHGTRRRRPRKRSGRKDCHRTS